MPLDPEMDNPEAFLDGLQVGESIEFVIVEEKRGRYDCQPMFRRGGNAWYVNFGHGMAGSINSLGDRLRYVVQAWNMVLRKERLRVVVDAAYGTDGKVFHELQKWFDGKASTGPDKGYGGGWPRGVTRIIFTVTAKS